MTKKTNAFTVSEHIMVPQHSKLSAEERDQFLEDNKLTLQDMPKILSKDAAIAHLDAESGDIIRIERHSPTAGWSIFYRGVIDE
jgi:DNA-directed RNA polymerase subunit H (RpoH/RPB5)